MAYNGRTGGVEVSGNDIIRPSGLFPDPITGKVILQPSRQLDFEIGIGMFVGKPVEKGETITAQEASDHIFGLVLHNDWSARDHQKFEMAPLGVFHSKSFSTSISPWVVTLDALQACVAPPPPSNLTEIHPMLRCDDKNTGMFDVDLPATVSRRFSYLISDPLADWSLGNGGLGVEITRSNHKDEYWSLTQMLAYHSLNGCGLKTGDLISTGTISSPVSKEYVLLECKSLTDLSAARLGSSRSRPSDEWVFDRSLCSGKHSSRGRGQTDVMAGGWGPPDYRRMVPS